MISKTANLFCSESLAFVENYKKAVSDKNNMWHLHHKKGTLYGYTKKELIERGEYYKVPPCDLIFLKPSEHLKMHRKAERIRDEKTNPQKSKKSVRLKAHVSKKGVPLTQQHRDALKKPKKKYVWLTPDYDVVIMAANVVSRCHEDWIRIEEVV